MISEQVIIAFLSMFGGIAVAYIANVASKKVQLKKSDSKPKDRMEQMFDGYERLIKQKDVEDDRKVKAMKDLEQELVFTRETVKRLENALAETQRELEVSREENTELRSMLEEMRREYKQVKKTKEA